jgi:hypothetical protein
MPEERLDPLTESDAIDAAREAVDEYVRECRWRQGTPLEAALAQLAVTIGTDDA